MVDGETGAQLFVAMALMVVLAVLAVMALMKFQDNCRLQRRLASRTLANPRTDQLVMVSDSGADGLNKTSGRPLGQGGGPMQSLFRTSDNVNMSMTPMAGAFPKRM